MNFIPAILLSSLISLKRYQLIVAYITLDIIIISFCYWFALVSRLDDFYITQYRTQFYQSLPYVVIIHIMVFYLMGLYRQAWRFVGLNTAMLIAKSVFMAILVCMLFLFMTRQLNFIPRFIPVLFGLFALVSLVGTRFLGRFAWHQSVKFFKRKNNIKRCFIYGAGETGDLLARYMLLSRDYPFVIVGFIDDDPRKNRQIIQGIRVLGKGKDLKRLVKKYHVETIIISVVNSDGITMNKVYNNCISAGIKPMVMPSVVELMTRKKIDLRDIDISDILKRTPKQIDISSVKNYYNNKCVLVTGAGGSIGSEICRQILSCNPRRLLLLENSENALYSIDLELREKFNEGTEIIPVLGSAADQSLVQNTFAKFKPDFVLHAAAYKHVPLGESNPTAIISNNLLSTRYIVEACIAHKISGFTLISSDKAVNPTNVMGATKRASELLVYCLFNIAKSECKYSAVRFGNVLGSSGSAVPRFIEQIKQGGPITVTHPDITRYFMSTTEAVGLVLQASIKANKDEIFVLDMGEPVKIKQLAENLISLSGMEPYRDIDIVYTGLRAGEKLHEELIIEGLENHRVMDGGIVIKLDFKSPTKILDTIDEIVNKSRQNLSADAAKMVIELANTKLDGSNIMISAEENSEIENRTLN